MSAGKGDFYRPVNGPRYRANWDAIFSKRYPDWICEPCGRRYGKHPEGNHVATYHNGKCGVCGTQTSVSEPRDFGHLRGDWKTLSAGNTNGEPPMTPGQGILGVPQLPRR